MSTTDLPFRASTLDACAWLAARTGSPWTLARLLEHGVTPYVWLDYDAAHADLFGDANGGYAAPIFFEEDIARLAAGSEDVLVTLTKDAYKIVARLPAPGWRFPLTRLLFQKKDLERLAAELEKAARQPAPKAAESQAGIARAEVLAAFGRIARLDLAQALDDAIGIFGDDGARVKASAKKSRRNAVWNPVTLALGLHDVYRAPLGPLKRAFQTEESLRPWRADWEQSLRLLGK
jgi:hypothetical protein